MNLTRRPAWMLLAVLLPVVLGGLFVHTWAARDDLLSQLAHRNQDLAEALAVALSQRQSDRSAMTMHAASQFALGHYQALELTGPDGTPWFEQRVDADRQLVPGWFAQLFPLHAEPGQARWGDGARALGQLRVVVRSDRAQEALWSISLRTAALLALLAAGAAVLAAAVMRNWRALLQATVAQAQALERSHFVEAKEPAWPELRDLTRAMNSMVRRLRELSDAQADQVLRLQERAQTDAVSGLPVRSQFVGRLADLLADAHAPATALLLVRVPDLDRLNERHGREATDHLLAALADVLMTYVERVPGAAAGRLNGTDFALCLPAAGIARETGDSIRAALAASPAARLSGTEFVVAGCDGLRGMGPSAALAAADAALARAEEAGEVVVEGQPDVTAAGARAWRLLLASALDESRVRIGAYPVVDSLGALIHLECPLRVQVQPGGEFLVARRWLALAARSRLMHQVDLTAVNLALQAIEHDDLPRCVHVAPRSFMAPPFAAALQARLESAHHAAARLSIEWTDPGDGGDMTALRQAVAAWHRLGVRVGVEHAGASPKSLNGLKEVGIDYVKVDARHVRGVADDDAMRNYAASLLGLIHGLGLGALAEGVDEPRDLDALWALGFDGATGSAVPGPSA